MNNAISSCSPTSPTVRTGSLDRFPHRPSVRLESVDWPLSTVVGENMCQCIWVSHRLIAVASERNAVVQAYILIQTEVGKAAVAAATISEIDGVASSEEVSGPYDVIVRVDATDGTHLTEAVVPKIQQVEGITRTLTCPVVTGTPRQG